MAWNSIISSQPGLGACPLFLNFEMSVTQKVIALWTAPRSISSAFERTFSQRKDTTTHFEPFFNVYHFSKWRQATRLGEHERASEFSPAKSMEMVRAGDTPLSFFKEMAFIYLPYKDHDFLQGLTSTFLIRRPEFSLKGWLKMDQEPTEEMLGFKKLGELWRIITQEIKQDPIVVEASKFQNDPAGTLKKYCEAVGIGFDPGMLSWEEKEHKTWDKELMTDANWAKWQETLNQSTGILPAPKEIPEMPAKYDHLLAPAREVYEEISAHAI